MRVERGLILQPCEVKDKSNEITAILNFIKCSFKIKFSILEST